MKTSLASGGTATYYYVTRANLPGISYTTSGNLYDGVNYWTSAQNDSVYIDATVPARSGPNAQRTTTVLDTGLGNDKVTATLAQGTDGFT